MNADPFHEDERTAQRLAGFDPPGGAIRGFMPEAHRAFFAGLPYLFVGVVDDSGGPVATVLSGEAGFISAPDATTLRIATAPGADDPARAGWRPGGPVGLLGIDLSNRRRNRANGFFAVVERAAATIHVEQSFGNCQKYIQRRTARPVDVRAGRLERLGSLDPAARVLVRRSDTAFVATRSRDGVGSGAGVDVSHRGGPPGFVVDLGDRLIFPDYPGNRYMNTLGNLLGEPRAAVLFVDFERSDVLQLQGSAEIDWRAGAGRSWSLHVERGWRRPLALPFAWTFLDYARTTLDIADALASANG